MVHQNLRFQAQRVYLWPRFLALIERGRTTAGSERERETNRSECRKKRML